MIHFSNVFAFFRRPFITSLSHVYLSHSCFWGRHYFDNPWYVYYSLVRTLDTINDYGASQTMCVWSPPNLHRTVNLYISCYFPTNSYAVFTKFITNLNRSSPYCEDMWRRYCCLTTFFRLSIYASVAKIQPNKVTKLCDGAKMAIFASFLRLVFPASRVQHISELHPEFARRSHHV